LFVFTHLPTTNSPGLGPRRIDGPGGRGRHEWYSVTNDPSCFITERKEPVPLCDHDHGHGGGPRDVGDRRNARWRRPGRSPGAVRAPPRRATSTATPGGLVRCDASVSLSLSGARALSSTARCTHAKHRRIGGMQQASSFEMLPAAGWHDDAMEWNRPSHYRWK